MEDTMTHDISGQLLEEAYSLDGAELDALARRLGTRDWNELAEGLVFEGWDTGGGCTMLVARTSTGHTVGLTDGDAGFPTSKDRFWLGVTPEVGEEEIYAVMFEHGTIRRWI